jgi:hypothetical protein
MNEPEEKTTETPAEAVAGKMPLPVFPGPGERLYFDEEIMTLQRFLIFFIGVSAGLALALHMILKRD